MSRCLLLLFVVACGNHEFSDPSRAFGPEVSPDASLHSTVIHMPETLGVADTPVLDANGMPIGVACATCHGPTPDKSFVGALDERLDLHGEVEIVHGGMSCDACHDPGDRTKLHLADGTKLEIMDAMRLCGQCHGNRLRDYKRGVHGGMKGYWDLRRGPRDRNHCVDCHAPHAPKILQVMPVFPPRDRYLDTTPASSHTEAH